MPAQRFAVEYEHGRSPGSLKLAFGKIGEASGRAGAARLSWASEVPYAYGIETGRHRGGRLARRAGGAYMMKRGAEEALRGFVDELKQEIRIGSRAGVDQTFLRLGRRGISTIRTRTPVLTGRLAGSIHMRLEFGVG
jgi:hypothetical protein